MVRCHCTKIETQVQELKRIAREVKLEQRKCDDHVGDDGAARSAATIRPIPSDEQLKTVASLHDCWETSRTADLHAREVTGLAYGVGKLAPRSS